MGQWADPFDCIGRNKTLPPSTSLPVTVEIAGVTMALLGGCLHSLKTTVRWAEGFHDELNGHIFNWRGMGSVRLYLALDQP